VACRHCLHYDGADARRLSAIAGGGRRATVSRPVGQAVFQPFEIKNQEIWRDSASVPERACPFQCHV